MANADNPFGFRPVSTITGGDWKGKVTRVAILAADGTATFVGDGVKLSGTASADGTCPSVAQASAGDAAKIDYVIVGFEPDYANEDLKTLYRKASTLRYAQAVPVQGMIFEIQEDSVGSNLAITDVGEFCNITVGSGSTATGISAMELDSSNAGTGEQCRILGLAPYPNNEIGANAIWRVAINISDFYAAGTGV